VALASKSVSGLGRRAWIGDDHLSQVDGFPRMDQRLALPEGEAEDVSRVVDAAIAAVQAAQSFVAGNENVHGGGRRLFRTNGLARQTAKPRHIEVKQS